MGILLVTERPASDVIMTYRGNNYASQSCFSFLMQKSESIVSEKKQKKVRTDNLIVQPHLTLSSNKVALAVGKWIHGRFRTGNDAIPPPPHIKYSGPERVIRTSFCAVSFWERIAPRQREHREDIIVCMQIDRESAGTDNWQILIVCSATGVGL